VKIGETTIVLVIDAALANPQAAQLSRYFSTPWNSLRLVPPWMFYLQSTIRKVVETTGSLLERLLPKSIHAVTAKGALFVLACSINFLW
jgi:hypothetical protein